MLGDFLASISIPGRMLAFICFLLLAMLGLHLALRIYVS